MSLSIWEVFQRLVRWQGSTDEEPSEEADSGFVASPLDLSVRIGHGGQDDDVVRELSKIEEQARELEENQYDN